MILEVPHTQYNPSTIERLAALATERLRNSEYPSIRNVACLPKGDAIVLTGKVPDFFHKQLAQTWLIRFAPAALEIENKLEVTGSPCATLPASS
jgi:hypothetical protein